MREGILSHMLGWLLSHLVALGFIAFALTAVVYRQPLWGIGVVAEAHPVYGSPAKETHHDNPIEEKISSSEPVQVLPESKPEMVSGLEAAMPVFRPLDHDVVLSDAPPRNSVPPGVQFRGPAKQQMRPLEEAQAKAEAALRRAREAFRGKDMRRAEAMYLRYLKMRPEDASAFAELGNLYRSEGRMQDALDAYYEAAVRFRGQGQLNQLDEIQGILSEAGDPRAGSLTRR